MVPGQVSAYTISGLLRCCRDAPAVGPTAEAASCAAVAARARNVWCGLGVGGGGASLHPALAGRLIETDERMSAAALPSLVSRGKKRPASLLHYPRSRSR